MFWRIGKTFLSWVYPSFCGSCFCLISFGSLFCERCYAALPPAPIYHDKTAEGFIFAVHAVSAYEGPLVSLVDAKEHRDQQAAQNLGHLLAKYCKDHRLSCDVIIATPLHLMRRMYRGYNQAECMAEILEEAGVGRQVNLFVRRRATEQQRFLQGMARKKNVARAFALRASVEPEAARQLIEGKRVLVIDDVYTTGSTMRELVRLVALFKPNSVDVLVACRVIKRPGRPSRQA